MLILIICSILIIVLIFLAVKFHWDFELWSIPLGMLIGFLTAMLLNGYAGPFHHISKEQIVYLLENNPNEETIELAKEYNCDEHMYNNYWCRFTIKDEDLIDIDYYLQKDEVKNE